MTIEIQGTPKLIGPCINCGEITGAEDITLAGEPRYPWLMAYDGEIFERVKATHVFIHRERCAETVIDKAAEALASLPVQA